MIEQISIFDLMQDQESRFTGQDLRAAGCAYTAHPATSV